MVHPNSQQPTSAPGNQVNQSSQAVTAKGILATLGDGATPMEIIKNSLGTPDVAPQPLMNMQDVANAVKIQHDENNKPVETAPKEEPKVIETKPEGAAPPVPAQKEGEGVEAPAEEPFEDGLEANAAPVAENFKKLRGTIREKVKTLREIEAKKVELETELADYKAGKIVPETLQTLNNRVAELEKYERIHNLKASPAYRQTFTEPISQARLKINEMAAEYGIPD